MSITVSSMLTHKGGGVVSIYPEATVFEAIGRMVEHNVGAIIAADGDDVRGIFTERDYLRQIALEGRTSRETRVEEVMTTDLVTVTPETRVDACLATMTERKIRHLPVLHAGRLVGVVSIGDCVRAQAEAARGEADELKRFVAGGYTG
ncbi:CBS domain-containing protein [Rubricoccus marinus]|uniref:Histidine kinase n=1 Tax=Rubricoccus marinus TaxID=716817 RepID=A0A259TVP7_9BACT|nr:CBS domain-containing protein [Rubricoccus marinus]OZC01839.1 histidine kinase [Rubricoccus marinus]